MSARGRWRREGPEAAPKLAALMDADGYVVSGTREDGRRAHGYLCVHDHYHKTKRAMEACEDGRHGAATGSRAALR